MNIEEILMCVAAVSGIMFVATVVQAFKEARSDEDAPEEWDEK